MKSLMIGIIMQLSIIFSIHYIFRFPQERERGCAWKDRGAKRGVLMLTRGHGETKKLAGGHLQSKQTLLQWDELIPVLSGIKDHIIFGDSGQLDTILNHVDVVFYGGPEGVMDSFKGLYRLFSFTYPMSRLDQEPFINNDKFVFQTMNEVFTSSVSNDTVQEALNHNKVLFILYLTSVALVQLKYPNNKTMMYETEHIINQEISHFQRKLENHYSDDDTTFLSIPHWTILKDKIPKLSLWGRGASGNFSSPIELSDVCPLLASLLGVSIPHGSVGRLPLSYLNMSQEEEAKALACNALQLHQLVFSAEFAYQRETLSSIADCISRNKYAESKVYSEQVIQISLSHLHRSSQTFDRTIFSVVIISLIGWILVLMIVPIADSTQQSRVPRKLSFAIIITFTAIGLCEILYVTSEWEDPFMYLSFMLLSLLPWMLVFIKHKIIWRWCLAHAKVETLLNICLMILLEETLNVSFDGGFLTVFFIAVIGSLPLLPRFHKTPFLYSVGWYTSCALIITLLNIPVKLLKAKRRLLNFSSTFWLCYGQSSVFYFTLKYDAIVSQILVIYMAISTILANAFVMVSSVEPYFYYLSWFSLTAILFPLIGKNKNFNRLIHLSLAFPPSLLLLSSNIESLSYFVLVVFVACWVYLERSHVTISNGHWCNLRRGVLLVFSCCLSYLLVGKIEGQTPASLLSSFVPIHVYWNNPIPFYAMLFFKHVAVHTTFMTIYISLITSKWKKDMGFVYGLIFIEMICLKVLVQFLFLSNHVSELVFKNIFFNMFAISYMFSYYLGKIYSTKYVPKEIKDLSVFDFMKNST